MKTVNSIQGETIDALCWRVFGVTQKMTEQVMELNRHLAEKGPILPVGTKVILPSSITPPETTIVQLWD